MGVPEEVASLGGIQSVEWRVAYTANTGGQRGPQRQPSPELANKVADDGNYEGFCCYRAVKYSGICLRVVP